MNDCKPVTTPILKQNNAQIEEDTSITFPYREAVGALSYLMSSTRHDIAFAVSVASRNLDEPTKENVINVKRIMRYLKGTMKEGIIYKPDTVHNLECYSDADHGGDKETTRSTMYAGGAISWYSKRQNTVAISSTEAEFVAASETAREIIWLQKFFKDLTNEKCLASLCEDNESAIKLAKNPSEFHQKTKHIKIRCFFIRECTQDGSIELGYVSAERQIAYLFDQAIVWAQDEDVEKNGWCYRKRWMLGMSTPW